MHVHAIDSYRPGAGIVHSLDPRVKLALGLLFILSAAITPLASLLAHVLLGVLGLVVVAVSRLGVGYVQRRAAAALPFALAAVTVVFYTPGNPVLTAELLGRQMVVTDQGLIHFASIVLKSWASIQVAVVLAASTPFASLLRAMRSLGLPKVLVATIGFAYRYIFVIGDEAMRMMRARAARSGREAGRGGRGLVWRARVTGSMVGVLFLRSIERAERIYFAMLSRGYDGEVRLLRAPAVKPSSVLAVSPFVLLVALIQLLAWRAS